MRRVPFILVGLLAATAVGAQPSLWTDVREDEIVRRGDRDIEPLVGRTMAADVLALGAHLRSAPFAGSANAKAAPLIVELPLPAGGFGRFQVEEAPMMEAPLAAKFPELRTFRVQGIDDPTASGRLDLTPSGFHAMVLGGRGSFWIDPFQRGDDEHYVVYWRKDYARQAAPEFECLVGAESLPVGGPGIPTLPVNGGTLRTYRLALAATGEYTDFHSVGAATVAEGMAAIVTAMNRVNGIYEREVALTMVLVANNDLVVYTNGATDPYTNNSGGTMLGQNQTNLNAVIGSANYDIGHVFSTGGGGIASLGVPCGASKARGVTGLTSPTGDVFWVDYVAHEMGHQWAGNHTFNGTAGSCSGGGGGETSYEPGSGSTIQAYAGICGSQNLQSNSDDYFHTISLEQIVDFITTGPGAACAAETATGNDPPTVDAGFSYAIPLNTPFELCGSGNDPDGDPLTFNWEQFNLGPAGAPGSPSGGAPIFRSWPSTTSPCRTFPRLQDLLAGTSVIGELLPTYGRTLSFRLTARDNQAEGGAISTDVTNVVAVAGTGPFRVTSPNTPVSWVEGPQTVTWDTAATTIAPISCSQVDILFSTDGGLTFPSTLVAATANDGSAPVSIPAVSTAEARVKVRCTGNVFFDVSNTDFSVTTLAETIFLDGFESGNTSAWSASVP